MKICLAPAVTVGLAVVVIAAGPLGAVADPAPPGPDLASAEECGRCHRDIHRYWKASLHAQAAEDIRFQDAYRRLKDQGADVDELCLRCHAPAALHMRDVRWEKKASWEGVTCDFCHSVRQVRSDAAHPFVLDVGRVKTGPLADARPVGHDARFAEVYSSSALCLPCHQFVNARGLDVLATYGEWQTTLYPAQNVTCQSCHMRTTTGRVVEAATARAPAINLHEMPGGHSITQLNRALRAQISAERHGDAIDVTVQITNRGAGHRVPTGSPLRTIVLRVEAVGGIGSRQFETRTYGRVVVDEEGQLLSDEGQVWLKGARVLRDNRFVPQEKRVERFSFAIPRHTPVRAVASFFYRYGPDPRDRDEGGTPFLSVNTWLDAEKGSGK